MRSRVRESRVGACDSSCVPVDHSNHSLIKAAQGAPVYRSIRKRELLRVTTNCSLAVRHRRSVRSAMYSSTPASSSREPMLLSKLFDAERSCRFKHLQVIQHSHCARKLVGFHQIKYAPVRACHLQEMRSRRGNEDAGIDEWREIRTRECLHAADFCQQIKRYTGLKIASDSTGVRRNASRRLRVL